VDVGIVVVGVKDIRNVFRIYFRQVLATRTVRKWPLIKDAKISVDIYFPGQGTRSCTVYLKKFKCNQ
jgi:hypothetical protein